MNDGRICYRCRNRKYGCPTDTLITERVMLREMARQLPQILVRTAEVTSAMWAKPGIGGDVEARLAAIRDRERIIRDRWLRRMQEPPDWLLAEVQELATARRRLEEERAAISSQQDVAESADEMLALLHAGRLSVSEMASQPPERQAAIWRRLISEARFTVGGTSGRGRTISAELIPLT
jgi:hypothetical protein